MSPVERTHRYRPFDPDEKRRRAVVVLPNGFTLFNLLCGVYAIVTAARGDFNAATYAILFGGVADVLDGRVARATGTGSRFGSELDSLVDAISFGLAPALIMYFAVFSTAKWAWLLSFLFTACAVIRLARFNIEQAGRAKKYFNGLPSPAAGLTLATYYWFSQTALYNETPLASLNWSVALVGLMALLSFLMISNVSYPAVPTVGFRKPSEALGTVVVAGTFLGMLFLRKEFYFPALVLYVLWGLAKTVFLGLLDRRPRGDGALLDDELARSAQAIDSVPRRGSRRRRRHRPIPPHGQSDIRAPEPE